MPRSLDPSSRLTLVLACDVDKPREQQPRFYARCLTLNQQRQLLTTVEAMQAATSPTAKMDAALDAAALCIVGWENMTDPATGQPLTFSREAIGDVLSMQELAEVFDAVTTASTTTADDKKKSESPH